MLRRFSGAMCAILLLAAARPAASFLYVRGSDQASGDLVAVWVKSNFELIVNLGPIDSLQEGPVASFPVPTQFAGSNLIGARFTALAVPNPVASFTQCSFDPPPPQYQIGFTTNGDPSQISPLQIANAQSVLDTPTAGQAWLLNLNNIPTSGDPNVIENTDSDALISTSQTFSYTANVGLGTDAIANNISPISTAVLIDPQGTGQPYSIALYEMAQTLNCATLEFGTQIHTVGYLTGDNGGSGNAALSLAAPEPGPGGLAAVAIGALAWIGRRRRAGLRSGS